jgi:chromosomal replication initiator protein
MTIAVGIETENQSLQAGAEMAGNGSVRTIALRVPATIRGHAGRPTAPSVPLVPVFIAGEENRFLWFVCQSPIGCPPRGGQSVAGDSALPNEAGSVASDGVAEATTAGFPAAGDDNDQWGLITMSPLLLVGPAGCGKTAIATHLATRMLESVLSEPTASTASLPGGDRDSRPKPSARSTISLFMPAVDFARYYARAVDSDEITRFRRDIDQAPVLVIDDVHLMVGKTASQDELAGRIESRSKAGRPTILTSRRLPTQVAGLRPLLVSRMLPGLTIPIRQPGAEARYRLLAEFARRCRLELGDEELQLLCGGLDADLSARHLEAAVAHVDLYCRMNACPPNVHAVRSAILSMTPTNDLSTDRVAKLISRRYKLKLSDLKSGTRRQEVVRARSLAMYLTRQLTGSSYHQIGKYFGGRDHTTVLHAVRKTESMLQSDSDLRVTADEIKEQLKATA